jgi:hypothetical protein
MNDSTTCPRCSGELRSDAVVCRHCFHVLGQSRWQHDAGRLGADGRGRGRPLQDPPIGPVPLAGSGVAGGGLSAIGSLATAVARLVTTGLLLRHRDRSDRTYGE